MRLTTDHIRQAPQFTNTMLQREIDLRGMRISSLDENVLVRLDNSFDVINLTSNALVTLDYFPAENDASPFVTGKGLMSRIETVIVHRNQLRRVSVQTCVLRLPSVKQFLADDNNFRSLEDIVFLRHWPRLEVVSLEQNPLCANSGSTDLSKLRAFIAFLCPKVKLINYERVTKQDLELRDQHRVEFNALVDLRSKDTPATTEKGEKQRKRGRHNRKDVSPEKRQKNDISVSKEDFQSRLEYIEKRMEDANISTEEFDALEKEMSYIIEQQSSN
ncbi:U2 small nuclear ribonucleoprotein A' [Angomonas deanei]|uniref:Leucine-rich repeat, putative n=1 Tax=Angomonas deanei TaxID=59799 RepID=S9VW35_9TRYP|nr:U2 small nuclear ribonucleoprotein A' [Angomonas deanei]EPY39826.1 U2 small nuclear ribonucleoprotein A' [Angomonas deanei]CAD2216436.1 Leucine-rich repeat, putative [Angomonas deanei]|eukprot:EPY31241.1 U2 small nuclear ribonucleoprotein A' [Angomonas deanei]